jgi:predicted dehydrogenase
MFDEMEKDIDAVTVSLTDHMHAIIAMAAMQRGKHVYVQKPLRMIFTKRVCSPKLRANTK